MKFFVCAFAVVGIVLGDAEPLAAALCEFIALCLTCGEES